MTNLISETTIGSSITMPEVVGVVEHVLQDFETGNASMPSKVYLDIEEHAGDFRAMPAYWKTKNIAGLKWVNTHVKNREKGLPMVMASLIVSNPETGELISLLDARLITALRTGAVGGVATKALAPESASVAAFIGAGVQAVYQLEAICCVRDIKEIRLYDPFPQAIESFKKLVAPFYTGKIVVAGSVAEAAYQAHVITMTTPGREPVLMSDMVSSGAHINAIGADAEGKQECDPELLKRSKIFVDEIAQASHSGEINVPLHNGDIKESDIKGSLGAVLTGTIPGRESESDITLFDSTGLAVQDIATAWKVLKNLNQL